VQAVDEEWFRQYGELSQHNSLLGFVFELETDSYIFSGREYVESEGLALILLHNDIIDELYGECQLIDGHD